MSSNSTASSGFVPPGSDLTITDGETINDRGEIAGSGMLPNGDFHAIVLVPCDDTEEGCQESRTNVAQSKLPSELGRRPMLRAGEVLAAFRSRLSPYTRHRHDARTH